MYFIHVACFIKLWLMEHEELPTIYALKIRIYTKDMQKVI